jgi:hypothetical protein
MTYPNQASSRQRGAISFLSWVGIAAVVLVCCQPIMTGVSSWVEAVVNGFPLLGQFVGLLRGIPFIGKGAAIVLLGIIKYAGALSALAIYALINLCQMGLVGGPRERCIAYVLEGAISLLNIPVYGSSFDDIVADFPEFDGELIDWLGMWRLGFSLFGPELAFGFLASAATSRYYTADRNAHNYNQYQGANGQQNNQRNRK